jgi:predicted MFS family arabinose efflux permease
MSLPRFQAATGTGGIGLVLTALLPFALAYYLSYAFRAVNAMIATNLVAELGLGPAELGLLTSIYFVLFAAIQIPLGILLDRYGPRQVQSILLLFAALGGVIFATGESFVVLTLGRACIGLGVSGCLMACFKANVMWFPRERLPLMNGIATSLGALGALSATVPVGILVPAIGWRGIFWALAALTVAVAALIYLVVPEEPRHVSARRGQSLRDQIVGLRQVYGSSFFWRLAVVASLNTSAFMSYQTLWAAPWLRDVAGLDARGVGNGLFLYNTGFLCGVLGIGALADVLLRRGIRPIASLTAVIALTLATEALFAAEATGIAYALCFAFGFFGSGTTLSYAVYGQHFPEHLAGRVNTAQNLVSFVVAFVMQWGIGEIVAQWPVRPDGGYASEAHQAALLVVMGLTAIAYVWFLASRRKAAQ